MTKRTLAELRAAYKEPERNTGESQFGNTALPYYPFWNMKTGDSVTVRFLPDVDQDNPRGFLVEKVTHDIEFNGKKRKVPCLAEFGEECPFCRASQDFYKAKDEINGKKYWKKRQYIAQVLIIEDPLGPDAETGERAEGKVRAISMGKQIYDVIKEAIADEDLIEELPYDTEYGYDFIIKKTEQGKFASYATGTKFKAKPRALSEDELVIVQENSIELSKLLPKQPDIEKVQAMLDASLNGEDYVDNFTSQPARKPDLSTVTRVATPVVEQDDSESEPTPTPPKVEPKATAVGNADVEAMLQQIRAKRKA